MEGYINIDCSGTFLKNAGIVGLIRFLDLNDAVKGKDYIIENYSLHLSVDYLKSNDIPQMYFDTVTDVFENRTKFHKVIDEDYYKIESYFNSDDTSFDKETTKKVSELFAAFETEILKKSNEKTFRLINSENISDITIDDIKEIKKEKDLCLKYSKYKSAIEKLKKKGVVRQFVYTSLLYGDFRYFFNENPTSHTIPTLDDSKKGRVQVIHDNFYSTILSELENQKKKKDICIECFAETAFPKANSFMVDTADDTGKKKSYYWNLNVDANVCPVCALLYLFVPLGFTFLGNTAIFVNTNTSIDTLYNVMNTYRTMSDDEESTNYYHRLYKIFSDEKIKMLTERLSDIQVVCKEYSSKHYNMRILDKNIIRKLNDSSAYLKRLEKFYLVFGSGKDTKYENVYTAVFDNLLLSRSLYSYIDKCIKYEFSKDSSRYSYIFNILKTEIIFNGGKNVNDLEKSVNWAFNTGKDMRKAILGEKALTAQSEDDNALRSYVYRLINLSSVNNLPQFMDTVLRQYSGYGLTIPAVFKNCYKSEDEFKAIAHGYILGLKYCKSEGEKNND